jgi:hypothetical protein
MEYVLVMEWQLAFAAMSIALGVPQENVLAALGPSAGAVAAELHLRSENKLQKAKALASTLGSLAVDIERAEQAWPS